VSEISAFIIAGGKSTRMGPGKEKAFLLLHGKTLIDLMIHKAKSVADDVFIVGPKEKFSSYGRVVEDSYPDCGPLGGIHAALKRSRTELNVVLPIDMPFVAQEFLSYLIGEAQENAALVTVPKVQGVLQPLCAVYRQGFLPLAEQALKDGKYKIDPLFSPEITSVIDFDGDSVKNRFDPTTFDNINSPDDYEAASKRTAPKSRAKDYS
jgi:molybdopterin-guanine dinucleotide biosynthesis protein A